MIKGEPEPEEKVMNVRLHSFLMCSLLRYINMIQDECSKILKS